MKVRDVEDDKRCPNINSANARVAYHVHHALYADSIKGFFFRVIYRLTVISGANYSMATCKLFFR